MGVLLTSQAHKLLGIHSARPTVKARLSGLTNEKFIIARGKGRGSYYEKK